MWQYIKECPFCGSRVDRIEARCGNSIEFAWSIFHTEDCYLRKHMAKTTVFEDNEDSDDIYWWNMRAANLHFERRCEMHKDRIEGVRAEALGWMYAEACRMLDRGEDLRLAEVSEILNRAMTDLAKDKPKDKGNTTSDKAKD